MAQRVVHRFPLKRIYEDEIKIETITKRKYRGKTRNNNNNNYEKKKGKIYPDIFVLENEITFGFGYFQKLAVQMNGCLCVEVFIAISYICMKIRVNSYVVKEVFASPNCSRAFYALLFISLTYTHTHTH